MLCLCDDRKCGFFACFCNDLLAHTSGYHFQIQVAPFHHDWSSHTSKDFRSGSEKMRQSHSEGWLYNIRMIEKIVDIHLQRDSISLLFLLKGKTCYQINITKLTWPLFNFMDMRICWITNQFCLNYSRGATYGSWQLFG